MVKQWYYQNVQHVVLEKSRFVINQEAKGLLSNLGLRTLCKVPILGDILFWEYKMNKMVHKFLLAGF